MYKEIQDVQGLSFEIKDVRTLLRQALHKGRYVNSEWCVQKPTGPWAACDSYSLVRAEWNDYAFKDMHY